MVRLVLVAVTLAAFPPDSHREEETVHLTVRPMSAPKPALKFQLLPEVRELNSGNAAQNYIKCFMEQRYFFFTKEAAADRARYQTMPLAELPTETLSNYGGGALRQADWAARMDSLDWQTSDRIQTGGLEAIPAELGPLQLLAAALHVRFRGQVAARRFDDAIRSAKTMLALGRHLGEHPTEFGNLIGLSTAHLALDSLEEMVQQSGCPNLYWALTDLPCPMVNLHRGVQGDRTIVEAELRPLHDRDPMTDAEIEKFVSRLSGLMSFAREQAGLPPRSLRARIGSRAKNPERIEAARRRLIESGCPRDRVSKFPPMQVILLDERLAYEIDRDDRMKRLALPLWQLDSPAGREQNASHGEADGDGLFADLLPHINKLRRTQGRLEQQIALLRHVEALRLYGAEHDAKLPACLSDIPVPLPADPVTGKPFAYSAERNTAHLRGGSLRDKKTDAEFGVHYEITLNK